MNPNISNKKAWLLASRPKTLPAVIAPILLGQFLAWQGSDVFSWLLALVILACALSLQVAVNLANDVFDAEAGVDRADRLGPARAVQSGWLTREQMKQGLKRVLMCSLFTGLILVWIGGGWYLLLGVLSILAALAYSAGPFPLASNALGELAVFLFFGLLAVVGSFHLQQADLSLSVWLYGTSLGLLTAGIMLVNNIRDRSSDERAAKFTLVVRLGLYNSRLLYGACLLLPCLWQISQGSWLAWLLLLPALLLWRSIYRRDGRQLNKQLAQTALFCLFYTLVVVADQW